MAWNGGGSGLKLGSADLLKFGAEEGAAALRSSSAPMTLMCPFNVVGSADIGSEFGAEEGAAAPRSTSSAPLTLKCPFKVIGSRADIALKPDSPVRQKSSQVKSSRHLHRLPSSTAGFRSTFDRLPYGCLLFMYRLDLTSSKTQKAHRPAPLPSVNTSTEDSLARARSISLVHYETPHVNSIHSIVITLIHSRSEMRLHSELDWAVHSKLN